MDLSQCMSKLGDLLKYQMQKLKRENITKYSLRGICGIMLNCYFSSAAIFLHFWWEGISQYFSQLSNVFVSKTAKQSSA